MADIGNYVKIHEAVQAFCEWSLPSIEDCIRQWHKNQQGTLPKGCKPPSTCPSYKNPNAKKSNACQSCRKWGTAVEGECSGRDVQWKNVDATVLHKDVVEVAKGFVFILPHGQTCASFDEFDVGGILKMMIGFKGYHGGVQACVDKIQKVVDIRNNLSHMKLRQQMHIPDAQTRDYFLNIKDLVTDLEGRHACLQSNTIMTLLDKIQSSDVTVDRIQRATKPLTDGLRQALLQAMKQQTQDLNQHVTKHCSGIEQLIKDVNLAGAEELQKQTRELQNKLVQLSRDFCVVTGKQSQYIKQLIQDGNTAVAEALQEQTKELQNQLGQLSQSFSVMTDQQTQYIKQLIQDGNTAGAEALQKQTEELQNHLEKLSQDIAKQMKIGFDQVLEEQGELKEMLSKVKEDVSRLKQTQDRKDEDLLDVQAVRKQLMTEYKQTRSQVQLLPGVPEECASMDEIFVDMNLHVCKQQNSSVRRSKVETKNLESHNDLLTIKDKEGQRMKHILVRGDPGCGKSTLISKIAYDWAKNKDPESVYTQFQLVFAIDFKEVSREMDLFDAIADQLLPKVSRKDLERFIERNSESVLFLFDGYDETYSSFPARCSDFKSVLSGTLFSESFVIMTTRPHKVGAINAKYKINYTHAEVFGLSLLSIFKYVSNFFNVSLEDIMQNSSASITIGYMLIIRESLGIKPSAKDRKDVADRSSEQVASFLDQIVESDHLLQICHYPIILTMLCFLWLADQDISLIWTVQTVLYREAVVHVAKNRCKENSDGDIDIQSIRKDVEQLLLKVGKIALDGLLEDKLIFTASEFDDDTLNDACTIGLVSKERKRSKLDPEVRVQFIHKTFQEMAAAYYWASLAESDESLFRSYQKQIDDMEDNEMVLRFCCGESVTAAESIIRVAVEKSCSSKSKTADTCFLGHHLKECDPWRLPLLLLFEVGHNIGKNEAQHLHGLLRPLVSSISIVAITSKSNEAKSEVWAVLKSFTSKVQSGTPTWFALVTKVIIARVGDEDIHDDHSQFPVLVSHMSNLKELIICYYGSFNIHQTLDSFLQCLIESSTASKSLQSFVLEPHDFQPQIMAKFLTGQKCLTTLQIESTIYMRTGTDSEQMIVDSVVRALKQNPLKSLVLDNMGINCKKVFDMLSMADRALPLTKLSLQRSCMVDGSIQSFAEAVHFLPDLKTLNLHHLDASFYRREGSFEEKDFKVFGPALSNLQNLKELDLGGHTIGNSVKEFGQGLQQLTQLQKLILSSTGLMDESAEFLPLQCLTELRTLYLGGNKIGKGIAKLSEKMKFLTNLKEFEFASAELTDDDVALLPLSSFKQLISLDLNDNALWSEGLCTIAKQLKDIPELQKLRVCRQHTSVSDEVSRGIRHAKGVVALLESIGSMPFTCIDEASLPDMCALQSDSQKLASVSEHAQSRLLQITNITHNGQVMVKMSSIWYIPNNKFSSVCPWV